MWDCQASQDKEEKEQLLSAAKKQMMKFSLSKCAEIHIKVEKKSQQQSYTMMASQLITTFWEWDARAAVSISRPLEIIGKRVEKP